MYLFCYAFLCVHSNFAIILKRKTKLVALLLFSYRYIVAINVLWLLLTVPWVGLQCVIVVFPKHTYLLTFPNKQITRALTRLRSCRGLSALLLFANPDCGFSSVEAQLY